MTVKITEKYQKEAIPQMMEKFGLKNKMAVPKIIKVVINSGYGREIASKTTPEQNRIRDAIVADLNIITGQKPVLTLSKKSISAFKLRENLAIGAAVTLRKKRMYDFLERLINTALPRARDFRGIDPKQTDKNGNLTIGIKEQIIFPEVSTENARNIFGLEITIVTNAKNREKGIELLKLIGFPLKS